MSIVDKEVIVRSWNSKDRNYMGVIQTSSTKLGQFVGHKVRVKIECVEHIFQAGNAFCIHCGERALLEEMKDKKEIEKYLTNFIGSPGVLIEIQNNPVSRMLWDMLVENTRRNLK